MHPEAWRFLNRVLPDFNRAGISVLEIGSRDINGTTRPLLPDTKYHGIDIVDGPGVDEVADAATFSSPHPFDLIVSTEVFEHAPLWQLILQTAHENLVHGGHLVTTCASTGRPPHAADGSGPPHPGEYYHNVPEGEMEAALEAIGFIVEEITFNPNPGDLYVVACKP